MKMTALNYYLVVVPDHRRAGEWFVMFINRWGNWSGTRECKTQAEARKLRKELYRIHAKVAKERETRRLLKQLKKTPHPPASAAATPPSCGVTSRSKR